jgi:hypothetical protein
LKSGQVKTGEIAFVDEAQHIRQEELAMAAGGLVRRQDAFIDPALDRGYAYTECLGNLIGAQVLRLLHGMTVIPYKSLIFILPS